MKVNYLLQKDPLINVGKLRQYALGLDAPTADLAPLLDDLLLN